MPVPEYAVEHTPVKAKTGKIVHATTLGTPSATACGKKFKGWVIALRPVTCRACKLALYLDARSK